MTAEPHSRRALTTHVRATPEIRLSLRAAFCLSAPLIVGLIINQRFYSIVMAIGALWAISQDGLDEWHVRGPRLLWVAISGTAGVGIGALFVNHHSSNLALVVLYGVVAFVAGCIEASNRATAGAYLLIGTILGGGLGFTGKIGPATLAVALGSLLVLVVAALMNLGSRASDQRLGLARAFNALADVVDAIGTAQFYDVRERSVATLDRTHDVIGSHRVHPGNAEEVAFRQCLIAALRVGEVISYLEGRGLSVDPAMASGLRELASTLANRNAQAAVEQLKAFPHLFQTPSGLDPVVLRALEPEPLSPRESLPLAPISLTSTRAAIPLRERARFGLILAVATTLATVISVVLADPHRYWLPLAVAFILRPDVGPVITRALARTFGTAVGVGIAALVALSGNAILVLIILSCVMAAIQPWASRRSHALGVMVFTPIVFVFLGLLGSDKGLFSARIIDTAIAAGIVLVLDIVAWTTAPSMRPAQQLNAARAALARYEREATLSDPARRNQLRRSALRAVGSTRVSLNLTRAEPRLLGRHDATTGAALDDVERAIDAHTVSLLEEDP